MPNKSTLASTINRVTKHTHTPGSGFGRQSGDYTFPQVGALAKERTEQMARENKETRPPCGKVVASSGLPRGEN